jgi:hypothetical protein
MSLVEAGHRHRNINLRSHQLTLGRELITITGKAGMLRMTMLVVRLKTIQLAAISKT